MLDANDENRGELPRHRHDGVDLDPQAGRATTQALNFVWNRPVHVLTKFDHKRAMIGFDGRDHVENNADDH